MTEGKKLMEVHRCRLYEYMPKSIQCFATNAHLKNHKNEMLAVGREGGSIDVYALSNSGWFITTIIPACSEHSVECLLWSDKCGLMSGNLQGSICVYNLKKGSVQISAKSYGGAVWSLALSSITSKIAAACEDGSIKIFTALNEGITFIKSMDKQEDRILSVDWHSSEDMLASGSLRAARVWSYKTGHALLKITVGDENTIVWTALFLSCGTLVTGDSQGKLQFWNSKHGTLISTHESHSADILCVKVSSNERTVYASGVDPKVIAFNKTNSENSGVEWVKGEVLHRHTHDVRALEIVGNKLISGGVDGNMLMKSRFIGKDKRIYKIRPFPHRNRVCYSRESRIVLMQYSDYLDIWKLPTAQNNTGVIGQNIPLSTRPIRLVQLRAPSNDTSEILSSTISQCGHWVAYSTINKLRLYHFANDGEISIERVHFVGSKPAVSIEFTKDSKNAVSLNVDGSVAIISLEKDGAHLAHMFPGNDLQRHLLTVNSSGKHIAVADVEGQISVYDIEHARCIGTLPRSESLITAMAFKDNEDTLIMVTLDRKVTEYNIIDMKYTSWSRKSSVSLLPPSAKTNSLLPPCVHITMMSKTKIIFSSHRDFFVLNQVEENKDKCVNVHNNFEVILQVAKMTDESLLVVEENLSNIHEKLPPTLYQKKFAC